jgi:hypothetical protein
MMAEEGQGPDSGPREAEDPATGPVVEHLVAGR